MSLLINITNYKLYQQIIINNFYVNQGEIISLIGKTGVGKSTFLKTIINNKEAITKQKDLNIGYLPQNLGLYEQKTVFDNIRLYYKITKQKLIKSEINKLLNELGLEKLINQKVSTLSGGEKAKVAIMRLLVQKPDLLIMDEPFDNLDEISKQELFNVLEKYIKKENSAVILISHNLDDIIQLSNRIYIMNKEIFEIKTNKLTKSDLLSLLEG